MFFNGRAFSEFFNDFADEAIEIRRRQREEKKQILREWRDSMKLPRKLKKSVRKRLALRFGIANYDPFPEMSDADIRDSASFLKSIIFGKEGVCS